MKIFLSLLLLAALASAGDKEYRKLKKWAMHKACESCMGAEAVKQHMIKVKTAAAKCMKIDAPELDLPMFKYPYRAVGALVDGAFSAHQQHGRPGMMHHGGRPGRPSHPPMMGGGGHHVNNEDYLDSMLKRLFFKKLVSKFIEEEFLEDEDEDDDPMGPAVAGGDGGSMRAAMKYFKQQGGRYRQKRQSGDSKKEMFELGDRLNVKLQNAKRAKEAEIGNFTCMLRECGVIDSNNRLVSPEAIIRKMRDIPINGDDTDGWLRAKLEEGVRTCHEFATAVPQSVLDACPYGPELAKVKMFKKCCKMNKMRTCMNYDIKKQLELNFGGSLGDLVETTQLDEEELLPLVMTLLHGPEMDM